MGGFARGSNPNQKKIYGRDNINYTGPTPVTRTQQDKHPDIAPIHDDNSTLAAEIIGDMSRYVHSYTPTREQEAQAQKIRDSIDFAQSIIGTHTTPFTAQQAEAAGILESILNSYEDDDHDSMMEYHKDIYDLKRAEEEKDQKAGSKINTLYRAVEALCVAHAHQKSTGYGELTGYPTISDKRDCLAEIKLADRCAASAMHSVADNIVIEGDDVGYQRKADERAVIVEIRDTTNPNGNPEVFAGRNISDIPELMKTARSIRTDMAAGGKNRSDIETSVYIERGELESAKLRSRR